MSNEPASSTPPPFMPPVSTFAGPVAELIAQQMLAPPPRPGVLAALGTLEVQRLLGGGGMGLVLLARDPVQSRLVAVKLVRPELVSDQRVLHRFVREAGHLQKLKHPNIVPVLEVSDRATGPYFVMPFFERGSLAAHIQPGQPLETTFALDISLSIAAGLQFAHRRGIIHRDLKPANILLTSPRQACLADFGLARTMFNDTLVDVESKQIEGTAPYLSPGVAAGNAEDTRCDIYAFGALLYEMLTGDAPYAGASLQEIRKQILAGPPKPIRQRHPAADAHLTLVAEGAMARELRDRYAEMSDVLADLQRIADGKTPVGPRGLVRGGLRQVRRVAPFAWLAAGAVAVGVGAWFALHPSSPSPTKIAPPVPAASNPPVTIVKIPPAPAPAPAPPRTNPAPVLVVTPQPEPTIPPAQSAQWVATILAGSPGSSGSNDGPGALARFSAPGGLAVDLSGNAYVADTGNNTIRKISPDGMVSTLAGLAGTNGSLDGLGSAARFFAPYGIAVDKYGTIYVSEIGNGTIRTITPAGQVSTLAGLAGRAGSADGLGDNALFRNPFGLAVDTAGNLYVADTSNSDIRKITPNGLVTTLAGQAGRAGSANGAGPAARFFDPYGLALDAAGNIFVADTYNNALRKIGPTNWVSTVAINPNQTIPPPKHPQSLVVAPSGEIYLADADNLSIRLISTNGLLSTLPATGGIGHPDAMAMDNSGNLYLADVLNNVIRKLTPPRSLASHP